ncbi:serine/threonine protein kinase [Trichophyton equinum CBS 127.97]|uniref:Serine/threonine protein kinase n=1 Tax=Trichophyton equinum (strain ATCC MYA-4606 / CBS 127.97) TaxID=559882 RepID=F2PV47_TRIEC|nr:serine/threonine protein kinase [Trichophyton equinum CBS 127.97]
MASTLVGSSGREYVRDKLLKHNPLRPDLSVYLAKSGDQNFVMKQMSDMVFDLALDHKNDFPDSRRLRIHIDENVEEKVVIYEYFDDNLLSFVDKNPNLNLAARKWILRELGESLKEFHAKNWIHIDVKPDNVMINYSQDKSGQPVPERVVLGDLDISLKMKALKLKLARELGSHLTCFSYGLVSLFTTTGVESLRPDFKQLEIDGVDPELEIMGRLMAFFGPVPSELVTLVQHEEWGRVMTVLSEATMDGGPVGPGRFTTWDEKEYPNLDSEAKRVLLRLMDLAPSKRATMEEI